MVYRVTAAISVIAAIASVLFMIGSCTRAIEQARVNDYPPIGISML